VLFSVRGIKGMRWFFIVWVVLSLTACTRPTETALGSGLVGHPVSDAVAKFGPPTTKFRLGNGRMAFDWLHYGPCTYSAMATSVKSDPQSLSDWRIETWETTADCEAAR
jgi:hypothetical protein